MSAAAKPGRNERCPCGSGRKFKHCCGGGRPAPRAPAAASTQAVLQLAERLLKAGQFEQAIAPLVQATRLLPNNSALFNDLGMACLLTLRVAEAVTYLRRSIALRPDFARTHYNLGLALEQGGDDKGALAAHLRASELSPELAEAHGRAGDILFGKGRRDEAAAEYERASAAAPGTPLGRISAAKALVARDRPREAEEQLRQLIALDPTHGEAHLALGHVLNDAGRFGEAAACFEQTLAIAPWQALAYHGLVSSRRLTEADRPVVERIVSRLAARDNSATQRMTLHFSAGKALDDMRDYAGAIEHFDAANGIRRRLAPFDRGALDQRVDRLVARFTREYFAGSAAMGCDDQTPVLILGMPRSGTTLIERVVSSHPRVAGGGELAFWNERAPALVDGEAATLAHAAKGLREDYLRVLRGFSPDALRVTDKMPFNFFWIGILHALFPRARIIHCRRNAIDTCLSVYTTHFAQNWGFASDRGDLAVFYRQYLRTMDHWRAVLPPDRLLEVDYEEMTAAPEQGARRLIEFCGLEWDAACLQPERNPDTVKTASKWQVRQPIYRSSVERWRNYEPWLGELRTLAPADPAAG